MKKYVWMILDVHLDPAQERGLVLYFDTKKEASTFAHDSKFASPTFARVLSHLATGWLHGYGRITSRI